MLEMLLDKYIFFWLMGAATLLGVISKFIVSITLKRLLKAAGNMSKSSHPLMRLVRAKFEHACMISETVENVRVFVDKYLYEYRVAGMRLHSWRRMEKVAAGACVVLGGIGAGLEYTVYGMQDMVLRTGAAGVGLAILVFLVHLTTDESYRLEAARNYMMDYLENICLHKYEKAHQKEIQLMSPEVPVPDLDTVRLRPVRDIPQQGMEENSGGAELKDSEPVTEFPGQNETGAVPEIPGKNADRPVTEFPGKDEEKQPEEVPGQDVEEMPPLEPPVLVAAGENGKKRGRQQEKPEEVDREVLIRQILEEFMA